MTRRSAGGTLARYSAEGVRTVVVTAAPRATWARLSDPRRAGDDGVGSLRDRELEAAARRLGVSRVARLGYFDSGMAGWPSNQRPGAFFAADLTEASERLTAIIREERPQVLVTYDETGGYGHPDHLKTHQVGVAAFEACAEHQDRLARLYFIRIPLGWSREFVDALRAAGIDAPGSAPAGADARAEVGEIGVADSLVTTTIDVRSYVDAKMEALACHASQMPPEHFLRRMPPGARPSAVGVRVLFAGRSLPPVRSGSARSSGAGRADADDFFGGLVLDSRSRGGGRGSIFW